MARAPSYPPTHPPVERRGRGVRRRGEATSGTRRRRKRPREEEARPCHAGPLPRKALLCSLLFSSLLLRGVGGARAIIGMWVVLWVGPRDQCHGLCLFLVFLLASSVVQRVGICLFRASTVVYITC